MAKMELEVGTCPTGILLALKSVEGRIIRSQPLK
ncbi:MAG: hypothetical protein Ct9H300mP28_11410 [Pseudomonadota bacterium]|nr:MAG: hypothetical protein Ct9H300mP28_11410 [Pseudomonadota bacterium]